MMPACYARYVDEKCWQLVDSKKTPNKEFIAYLLSIMVARFRARYPVLDDNFTVKMVTSAQIQLVMLARILCVSALANVMHNGTSMNLNSVTDTPLMKAGDLCKKFHLASIEHDAWAWFSGAIGPDARCSAFMSVVIPAELISIASQMVTAENAATVIPGSAIHADPSSDRLVECAMFAMVDSISTMILDFWGPSIDLEEKTSIQLSSSDISGVLRLFNHDRIPAQSQFFIELGRFGNQFETIKRAIKAREAAAKPPKVARKKR
jgi:hypothetical protein